MLSPEATGVVVEGKNLDVSDFPPVGDYLADENIYSVASTH